MTTQPAHNSELFSDELGTYWLVAAGRTPAEARKVVADAAGPVDDGYDVREVRGVVTDNEGEPWFTPSDDGERFWEVCER